ncbi:MAG: hypothetical protein HFE57_05390 [Firmicutes bacterium]|nr:hypothetical protein [Bacillota bacterium]
MCDRQIGKTYSQPNRWRENSFDCSSLVYKAFDYAGAGGSAGGTESEEDKQDKNKEITSIKTVYSADNKPIAKAFEELRGARNLTDNIYELLIEHNGRVQMPIVCEGVTVEFESNALKVLTEQYYIKNVIYCM